jgi:hypothetical protein
MELNEYLEQAITRNVAKLSDKLQGNDEIALAALTFLFALKRVVAKKATASDVGTMDAINDTLQFLDLLESKKVFYKV